MTSVVFLSSDLMFSSRLASAAQSLALKVQLVAQPSALGESLSSDCRMLLVDLALDGLDVPSIVTACRSAAPEARIVAFGAHVNEAALSAATDAGCDLVLTRGQFHKQYAELLRQSAA
jgi:DNA-binding NarL/FixJ family response regulator